VVAKWRLFDKCKLSKREILLGTLLPVYDFFLTLKIVGRPGKHMIFLLIPVFNIFFMVKVLFELLNCFGKFHIIDYLMAILFNILYFLNLGLAYNEVYYGTVYDKTPEEIAQMKMKAEQALA
jgi:signal peptidase I